MTGIIVDLNFSSTRITPIYEGTPVINGITILDVGGKRITDYLKKLLFGKPLLRELFHNYPSNQVDFLNDQHIFRDIKEKLCYVALDPEKEYKLQYKLQSVEQKYKLPDQTLISIGADLFIAPECLFAPYQIGLSELSIIDNISFSLMSCSPSIRKELFKNIILSGGSSLFPGLKERFSQDLQNLSSKKIENHVITPSTCQYGAWFGALRLGNYISTDFNETKNLWIDRETFKHNQKFDFSNYTGNLIEVMFGHHQKPSLNTDQHKTEIKFTSEYEMAKKQMYNLRSKSWKKEASKNQEEINKDNARD